MRAHPLRLLVFLFPLLLVVAPGPPLLGASGDRLGPSLEPVNDARLADLEEREGVLALRSRAAVAAEVRQRAGELDVEAAVEDLTDLLFLHAWLELAIDRCVATVGDAAACGDLRTELDAADAQFLRLAGLSVQEFRSGRREADAAALLRASVGALTFPGGSTRTDPQYCVCSVTVSNFARWMNRYWGLECACHSGHGVCSNDLDLCSPWPFQHSPGVGAMTGNINLGFGNEWRSRSCPDDHRTCFKGPKPSKTNGGEWTNVCNCDIGHSQFVSQTTEFFGGDATDAILVTQASFPNVVRDGPCVGAGLGVQEYIVEHDPVCCDDPMGTLTASVQVQNGARTVNVPASTQNCNGGSQSGQPPNCGTFGATIQIQTSCQTLEDDSFGSCFGRCGEVLPDATCNCDFDCQVEGDCCLDYCDACSANGEGPAFPCDFGSQ